MAQIQNVDIETQLAYIAGAKRVRRELFGGKDAPVVTISRHGLSFNSACVSLMEGVAFVEILLHPVERLLAVRKRSRKCKNVVPWGMKVISAKELSAVIYDLMGWRKSWKYRSLANCFTKGGDQVLLFDLNSCEFRLPRVERGEGPARAVPSSWLSDFGESPPEQLMLCRHALASTLGQWQVGASASAVDGFGNEIKTLSREEAEKRIADMRSGGEIHG